MDEYGEEFNDADIEAELERELAALGEITAEEIAEAQKLMGESTSGSGYECGYLRPRTSYDYALYEEDEDARAEQERAHARACEEARLAIASLSEITVAPLEDAQLSTPLPTPPVPAPEPAGDPSCQATVDAPQTDTVVGPGGDLHPIAPVKAPAGTQSQDDHAIRACSPMH